MNKIYKLLAIVFFTAIYASNSYAFGIGAYGTVGGGHTALKTPTFLFYVPDTVPIRVKTRYNNLAIGGGLVLDTCLAALDVFNYRLKIGLEQNQLKREKKLDLLRAHMDHLFAFGLIRTPMVRWWLGLLLEGRYSWGENQGYLSSIYQYGGALGAATGINLNVAEHFTIGLEGGFKYGLEWGSQKWSSSFNIVSLTKIVLGKSKSFWTRGYELYGAVSVFYRVGDDRYSRIRYVKAKE